VQPAAILDQLLGSGSLTADHLRFLDLLGNRNGRLDVGDVRAWLIDSQQLSAAATAELRAIVGAVETEPRPDDADPSHDNPATREMQR
jgi:hypothetical protein